MIKPARLSSRDRFMERQFLLPLFVDSVVFPDDWSFEEVLDLHEYLLEESLSVLAKTSDAKAVTKNKVEVLDWIFAPDIEQHIERGKVVQVDNTKRPLSFFVCCKVMGIDPEELRDQICTKLETKYRKAISALKKAA